MALIPQSFKDAVVAIGANGKWVATGFVVARKNENGGYNTFLVTNKHVFEKEDGLVNSNEITLRFNLHNRIDAKDFYAKVIKKDEKHYSVHPNPNVDVAAMLLNGAILKNDLGELSAFLFENEVSLTRKDMIDNDVLEGSLVYMLGFPSGIVGLNSKVPLIRLGCISRISDVGVNDPFLVDIQNFPGSCGSPIINRLESIHLKGSKFFQKTSLVGIVSGYLPYEDLLISAQTGKVMEKISENSGIAVAFGVDCIKEVVEIEFSRVSKNEVLSPNEQNPNIHEEDK